MTLLKMVICFIKVKIDTFVILLLEIGSVNKAVYFRPFMFEGNDLTMVINTFTTEVMLYQYSLLYYLVQENIIVKGKNTFFQR